MSLLIDLGGTAPLSGGRRHRTRSALPRSRLSAPRGRTPVRDDRERLRDVLEAIEQIEKYTLRGQEALANEELLQTWVAHHLMIIGEACRALSADFRTTHPAEVRALAAGLRTPSGNDAGFTAHNAGASPKINNSFTFRPFCLSYRKITRRRVAARFLPGAFREFPPGPIARRPGSIDPLPPCAPAK